MLNYIFKENIIKILSLLIIFLVSLFPESAFAGIGKGHVKVKMQYNWEERPYIAYIPDGIRKKRKKNASLFVVLHGGMGSSKHIAEISKFSKYADEMNFVVVYPQGKFKNWNAGDCCSNLIENKGSPPDDVGYIKEVIKNASKRFDINRDKVYVVGVSNGGMMAYRIGCELADVIKGIGVVAGNMQYPDCNPSEPIDVLIIHAKDDENTPYYGGVPKKGIRSKLKRDIYDKPIMETAVFWSENNNCQSFSIATTRNEYSTYTCHGKKDARVKLILLDAGGHTWYGGNFLKRVRKLIVKIPFPIESTKELLDFFLDY